MLRWFYVALHLLFEAGVARLDTRIRFLKAQAEILVSRAARNLRPSGKILGFAQHDVIPRGVERLKICTSLNLCRVD